MKSLQQHLNESLINEAYKAQFKPADWENVLKQFKPAYSNYSQLGGIESYVDDGSDDEETISEWINDMIRGGIKDTPENRDILKDIFMFVMDRYTYDLIGWRDDTDTIIDWVKDMSVGEWAVSEEDYVVFMSPKQNLNGADKKYGEILAKHGDSGEVAEIAASYEE